MTSRRLKFLVLAAAILMATTLPRAAAPVEIVVWHGYRGGEKTASEKVVAAYNASRASRGVKASTLAVAYDAYPDKISATVPRGKGPDVFIYAPAPGSIARPPHGMSLRLSGQSPPGRATSSP
jgi:arabinogalactan oligomer / maltooligosaccharide transport system substrate-binding protein